MAEEYVTFNGEVMGPHVGTISYLRYGPYRWLAIPSGDEEKRVYMDRQGAMSYICETYFARMGLVV